MFGKSSDLTPLAVRKQLLIATSELNRARLINGITALKTDVHALATRAESLGSLASAATMLVAGLTSLRHTPPTDDEAKPSRFQSVIKVAGLVSNLWHAFRSRGERNGE